MRGTKESEGWALASTYTAVNLHRPRLTALGPPLPILGAGGRNGEADSPSVSSSSMKIIEPFFFCIFYPHLSFPSHIFLQQISPYTVGVES